jgi:hypothetical protein
MVIVDATVWIGYLRGDDNRETGWLETHLTQQPLGSPTLLCVRYCREFVMTESFLKPAAISCGSMSSRPADWSSL